MIEELVHTKEGELRLRDPYLLEGSMGYYIANPEFVFEVTLACIRHTRNMRAQGDIDTVYVNFIEGPRIENKIEAPLPYGKDQLRITKEGK